MRNFKQKLMAIIITLMLVVSTIPFGAFSFTVGAEANPIVRSNGWYIDGAVLTITANTGNYETVWEDLYDEEGMWIDCDVYTTAPWSSYRNQITEIVIADGVTCIGERSFQFMYVDKITVPASVTSICDYAFDNINSVGPIGSGCQLEYGWTTSIPSIGTSWAYSGGQGITVVLPDEITHIGYGVFANLYVTHVFFNGERSQIEIEDALWYNGLENAEWHRYSGITGDLQWRNNGTTLTISGNGRMPDYAGNTTNGFEDGEEKPWGDYFSKVVIESGVTYIGKHSFENKYISCIEISNTVETIGEYAFSSSGLNKIIFPGTLKAVKDYAFMDCGNMEVEIPQSDLTVSSNAFYGCSVTALYSGTPEEVKARFSGLENCYIDWIYTNGTIGETKWIFDGNELIISGNGAIGDNYCSGASWKTYVKKIKISSGITYIGKKAFSGCDLLESVTIPEGVQGIGEYAFSNCDLLESVTIPKGVQSIGNYAFKECYRLETVSIPDTVKTIGYGAFYYCFNVRTVHITDIAAWCEISFSDSESNPMPWCSEYDSASLVLNGQPLTDLVIPNGVTCIGDYAFYGDGRIKSISIPNSVTRIGAEAFYSCVGITSITIPNSVTDIGSLAFGDCTSLSNITAPFSCTKDGSGIKHYADVFNQETGSYDGVTLTVTGTDSIADRAFYECWKLKSVILPDSVTSIGNEAFYGCYNLENITIPNGITIVGDNAFENTTWFDNRDDGIIYIGKTLYKNKGACPKTVSVKDGTVRISGSAFYNCSGLESVTIPKSVIDICNSAFYGCSGLTDVVIENGVENIDDYAFYGCSNLGKVVIPESVIRIGNSAFYGCNNLENATIPNGITIVGDNAFENTTWFENQNDGVIYIGKTLYKNKGACPKTVSVKDGTVRISGSAFNNCSGLESVTIPKSVVDIGNYAFCCCRGLTEVIIENGVKNIGDHAFYECSNLGEIVIPESVMSMGHLAFGNCWLFDITVPYIGSKKDGTGDKKFSYVFGDTSFATVRITGDGSINLDAFSGCYDISIIIGKDITNIVYAAGGCYISDIDVEEGNLKYKESGNCLIDIERKTIIRGGDNFSIPNDGSVTAIGAWAFGDTMVEHLVIPDAITSIGALAFANVHCKQITIGNGIKNIGDAAFSMCSITDINIPNSVVSIDNNAFEYCYNLKSITIGSGVKSIGNGAFNECWNITDVYYKGTPEQKALIDIKDYTLNDIEWKYIDEYNYGDVNQDGNIDILDLIRMKKAITISEVLKYGDLDGDNDVDAVDMALLIEYILGIIKSF